AGAETQLTPANAASPLLRGNSAAVAYQTNSVDAVAFVRAWNLHLKLRAESGGRASVGEAFVEFAPRPWLTISAGRIIEKWGTGYAWNPVAFISPRKNPADPGDRRSSYAGLDMIRADALLRDTSVSLYALEGGRYAARVDAARDARTLLAANAAYAPLHMARNYAFVRVDRPGFIEAELLAIANLRDGSALARLTLSRKLRPNLSAYLIDTEFAGRRESEMSYIQAQR